MKGYFVSGTDTGVGKTHVTCALATMVHAQGLRVFAYKPIETGCTWIDGQLVGADQEEVAKAAGDWQVGAQRGLYRFEPAAAPLVAARGATIDLERIRSLVADQNKVDFVLVEGAGGWRVPITSIADMGTLAKLLDLPVLVVARAGLGTINHSLLTIETILRDGCVVAGVVLSKLPTDDQDLANSNREQIHRRWNGTVVVYDQPEALRCFT